MPTQPYYNKERKRLKGVTTILKNIGWGTDPLMWWAWDQGMQGLDYKKTAQDAASAGTWAHAQIENDLTGKPFPEPKPEGEIAELANKAFEAWLRWKAMVNFELVACEVPLISEIWQYGGTLDWIARISGKLSLVDFKTSKDIYPKFKVQMSAYKTLWDENNNYPFEGHGPIEEIYLLRIGKDGSFSFHHWPISHFDTAWEAFKAALMLDKAEKQLK